MAQDDVEREKHVAIEIAISRKSIDRQHLEGVVVKHYIAGTSKNSLPA